MSYYFSNIKPDFHSDDDEDELESVIKGRDARSAEGDSGSEDELKTLSFGSLKKADDMMESEERSRSEDRRKNKSIQPRDRRKEGLKTIADKQTRFQNEPKATTKSEASIKMFAEETFEEESASDSEGGFFEEDSDNDSRRTTKKRKGKSKHAPTETSSKKRVKTIRQIPGLDNNKAKAIYQDIRFDKALGKSEDLSKVRQRYKFLDEYREKEIKEMEDMLRDRKFLSKISGQEKSELEQKVKKMKSRLETVQVMDMEQKIVKEYEEEINKNNKTKYHLKDSEKRKVIQKWKFEHMKGKQREKVMERKRKKKLGKEFKQFEFHKR